MYNNIKSGVFVNGEQSDFFVSNVGVRQGENLSPLSFSLYINDLARYLLQNRSNYAEFNIDICERYLKLLVLMYADDTVLLANTAADLQKALDNLEKYCLKWKLKVNCQKPKITVFGKSKVNKDGFRFKLAILPSADLCCLPGPRHLLFQKTPQWTVWLFGHQWWQKRPHLPCPNATCSPALETNSRC